MTYRIGNTKMDSDRLIYQGYLLISQRLYPKAINHFMDILSIDPNNENALVGLATSFNYLNKPDEAIKIAFQALDIDPNNYQAWDILAEAYFINKKDYIKAEGYALESLRINNHSSQTFSLLAQIYYFQNRYDECFYYAKQSLELDPENYIAHMTLGLYYSHIPDLDKVEEHYKKCLELAPNSSVVYGNYGLLNLTFAKNKIGYSLLKEAVLLNPNDTFLQDFFREAYIRNNIFYSPLGTITNNSFDDSYLIYGCVIVMMISVFIYNLNLLDTPFKQILILFFLASLLGLSLLVIYRFVVRFFINLYYTRAVKKGILSKII